MKIETNLVKINFFKHMQIQPLKEKNVIIRGTDSNKNGNEKYIEW